MKLIGEAPGGKRVYFQKWDNPPLTSKAAVVWLKDSYIVFAQSLSKELQSWALGEIQAGKLEKVSEGEEGTEWSR